jgi:hypothetical protein
MAPPRPKYADERGRIVAPGIERPDDMTPVAVKLPSIDALKNLTPDELLEVSQRYGVYAPWRELWQSNAQYVAQFSAIPPGSPAFWDEVRRITDPEQSARAALGLARSAQRNYNQLLATDGDETQLLVRVGEGDDAMCDGCIDKAGFEGTYAEHDAEGLPGSQECGQNCRCVLMPVDVRGGEGIGTSGPLLEEQEALATLAAILGEDW